MKVAIYCRISREDQSIDKQEQALTTYCKRMDYPIYKIYKDIISGSRDSKPAFNELLKDMRSFSFDTIMVTKLDRLGRSLKHLLSLFDKFAKKGIHFIATTQNIDTSTSIGKLQMQMMGAFAEFERNIISERTKEGLKGNKLVGKRGKDKKPRRKRNTLRKRYSVTEF